VTSTLEGELSSDWCKVAVTVTNESSKSVAVNRKRNNRKSSKKMTNGEYPLFKSVRRGGLKIIWY
jgi:hypothetical protein